MTRPLEHPLAPDTNAAAHITAAEAFGDLPDDFPKDFPKDFLKDFPKDFDVGEAIAPQLLASPRAAATAGPPNASASFATPPFLPESRATVRPSRTPPARSPFALFGAAWGSVKAGHDEMRDLKHSMEG